MTFEPISRIPPLPAETHAASARGSGSTPYPLLFSPFQLGTLSLPNRIVMAPMSSSLADEHGFVTPELVAFIRERAAGGTGMVVVEFSCVEARHGLGEFRQPRIDDDRYVAGHATLVRAIHAAGARSCLQLHLPGQYVVPGSCEPGMVVAPSEVVSRNGKQVARALRSSEIHALVEAFASGARRAVQAGYQAIEIHGAHGYLPMAFLSPRKNVRNDEWGGDFGRRLAFPLAVVRAVRKVLERGQPLVYRLSASEFVDAGLTLADMEAAAPALAAAGCDALHVSTGAVEGALDKIVDPMSSREGWRFPFARNLRKASGLPVIAVGPVRWPSSAEQALVAGDVDLVALGRPLLADPAWANKARTGLIGEIRPCTNCNWCMERTRAHLPIGCAENPRTGHELTQRSGPLAAAGRVAVVVGAGPGGLHAALELAQRGYITHLFEAQPHIGGGLLVSAAPPDKVPLYWYWDYLRRRLEASRVHVHLGRFASGEDILALNPAFVVVATGSRAKPWPAPLDIAQLPVRDATDVLTGQHPLAGTAPAPVVVYGGGETGCETAEFLAAQGMRVTLVSRSGAHELARAAEPIYRRELRRRLAANRMIEVLTGSTIAAAGSEGVAIDGPTATRSELAASALVVAQGRAPARELALELMASDVPFEVIGDARSIGRIGDAVHDGEVAVRKLVEADSARSR